MYLAPSSACGLRLFPEHNGHFYLYPKRQVGRLTPPSSSTSLLLSHYQYNSSGIYRSVAARTVLRQASARLPSPCSSCLPLSSPCLVGPRKNKSPIKKLTNALRPARSKAFPFRLLLLFVPVFYLLVGGGAKEGKRPFPPHCSATLLESPFQRLHDRLGHDGGAGEVAPSVDEVASVDGNVAVAVGDGVAMCLASMWRSWGTPSTPTPSMAPSSTLTNRLVPIHRCARCPESSPYSSLDVDALGRTWVYST